MTSERNNTALEFETMLRRHLKNGGAPVVACAGFDFDTASAYLEDALARRERACYESHLAGCASCRRHLIELSRLAQTVPHTETPPAPVTDQALAWARWREAVAGWADLSGWNLKWQMIGAALAMLIAALGIQSWRQVSGRTDGAIAINSSPSISVEPQPQPPAPEPSPEIAQTFNAVDSGAVDQQSRRASVPEPPSAIGPKADEANVAVVTQGAPLKLNSPQPSGALQFTFSAKQETPAEVQHSRVELPRSPAPQPMLVSNSANVGRDVLAKDQEAAIPVLAEQEELRSNDITARMTPPPGINPMNLPPRRKAIDDKKQAERPPSRLYELARALVPGSKSESGRKTEPEPLGDESFKPLVVRIRDKVFRFDGKTWIDQAYKPEMEWRVLKLTRGSKHYEQALSDEPSLKEFFDHGPMIIVWKDKIYKVR